MKPLNCNGCTACCRGDAIFIYPECGDEAENYLTEPYQGRLMLQHKPDGSCIYLEENGCGKYEHRPTVCKELDCRVLIKKIGFTRARKMVKKGQIQTGTFQAAMRRL